MQVSGVKMGCFHKVLPNVKSAYVTFQNFTPDLQKFYTDISAVSATLSNSVNLVISVDLLILVNFRNLLILLVILVNLVFLLNLVIQ